MDFSTIKDGLRRVEMSLRFRLNLPAPGFRLYDQMVSGKHGLEIGGPSDMFRSPTLLPIYQRAGTLDNCDFSSHTRWADHAEKFEFLEGKAPGRSIFCDGSRLEPVADSSYDFVLSSHNLEHFANPVKALLEWKRVLRPGGAIVLVLPYFRGTFDHRRTPTPVAAMMEDFERNVGEDDLSHLEEILEKHDLSRDPGAGSLEDFRVRSLDNFNNRCLHHHVFDGKNIRELLDAIGFTVLSVEVLPPTHVCALARV